VSGGPYRPDRSSPDEELTRLAAEGQRRILDARASATASRHPADDRHRERNLRIALGGHYYGPVVQAATAVSVVVATAAPLAAAVLDIDALYYGALATFAVFPLVFVGPRATRARVRAEEAWVRSLPFTMDGYFDVLRAEPVLGVNLVISIRWCEAAAPSEDTLQGMLGLLEAGASIVSYAATEARIRSGSISGRTNINTLSGYVHRNTRLVGYVHRLVERILLPLHHAGRLAQVSLSRE
jgi:hypothetical protein